MQFVAILASIHLQQAKAGDDTLATSVEFKGTKVDTKCYEAALKEYMALKLPTGTIDLFSKDFFDICISALQQAVKDGKTSVRISNGCCTTPQCPIGKFYQIIAKHACACAST